MAELPPCGIFRTEKSIGEVPAGKLVYFHNHGDPGPGIYLPEGWRHNRAQWSSKGILLGDLSNAQALHALPAEGFYRVHTAFHCCEKMCRLFENEQFVQLGYNGAAQPLIFVPTLGEHGVGIPETGSPIDEANYKCLTRLRVASSNVASSKNPPAAHLH